MLGVLDGYDWYDLSYSSLSFHMSGVFCVFLLVNWYWFLRLIRPVMSVAIVTANTAVLWIFLIFWMLLLQLIFVIVEVTACTVLLGISGISWMYDLGCSRMVTSRMAIAIIAWRGTASCGVLVSDSSWISSVLFSFCYCVSAMSHPKSGILLFGTAFLPSLVFPVCSS